MLGATSIIKNSIGFVGIIIIIGICVMPIIKLTVLSVLYSFMGAITEPPAEETPAYSNIHMQEFLKYYLV